MSCAEILIKYGADINAKAGFDSNGFGGHTPIFHTVNQDGNKSIDVLKYLIKQNADLTLTVKGLYGEKVTNGKLLFLLLIQLATQ